MYSITRIHDIEVLLQEIRQIDRVERQYSVLEELFINECKRVDAFSCVSSGRLWSHMDI